MSSIDPPLLSRECQGGRLDAKNKDHWDRSSFQEEPQTEPQQLGFPPKCGFLSLFIDVLCLEYGKKRATPKLGPIIKHFPSPLNSCKGKSTETAGNHCFHLQQLGVSYIHILSCPLPVRNPLKPARTSKARRLLSRPHGVHSIAPSSAPVARSIRRRPWLGPVPRRFDAARPVR